jgi:hypothetical protein
MHNTSSDHTHLFSPISCRVTVVCSSRSLQTLLLEGLDGIHDRLLERLVLETQDIYRPLVVIGIQSLVWCTLWVVAAGCRVAGQVLEVREVLLDDLAHLLVGEVAFRHKEPLVGSVWFLEGCYVCLCDIAYINPEMHSARWNLVLELALCRIENALIGCVHVVKAVERVYLVYSSDVISWHQ